VDNKGGGEKGRERVGGASREGIVRSMLLIKLCSLVGELCRKFPKIARESLRGRVAPIVGI